jgi:thioredoxin-related protein
MKLTVTNIISILILAFFAVSFESPSIPKKKGIEFSGNWNEALAKAKTEKKFIFLDIYATWCGPCKKLKRTTFKDSEVGEYYNKNFVNVSIDGETPEGLLLAEKYQVTSYPTLLIVDHAGKKKTKAEGFMKPRILVNFGRRIVP